MRSRFGASLEPLAEVVLEYHEKEGRELVTIASCELISSVFELESEPEGQAVIHYMVDLTDHFLPPHQPNEKMYRLIGAVVNNLRAPRARWSLLLVYFETWILKLGGFFPQFESCANCQRRISANEPLYLAVDGRPECMSCKSSSTGIILPVFVKQEVHAMFTDPPDRWSDRVEWSSIGPFAGYVGRLIGHVLEAELRTKRLLNNLELWRNSPDGY